MALGIAFMLAVGVGIYVVAGLQAYAIMDRWAAKNGWQFVEQRWVWNGGPFGLAILGDSGRILIYRIVVEKVDGLRRSGFIACGYSWKGLWPGDASVKWDE